MKKLVPIALAITMPLLWFSCSQDGKEPVDGPFEPVSVSLSAVMSVNDINTKAESFPTNIYELNDIYLMVDEGGIFIPHHISLMKTGDVRKFDLRITAKEEGRITISSGEVELVTVDENQQMFFSSHQAETVGTVHSTEYQTPKGNSVYQPFGKDIYRSDPFGITLIPGGGGFSLLGDEYLKDQDNAFDLVLFRLTGSFRANVIFFRQETPDMPLSVTAEDWLAAGLGNPNNWTVTPYLRDYYSQFSITEGDRGMVQGAANATYILSKGNRPLRTETINVHKGSANDIELTTFIAGTSEDFFPYLFSGNISNSILAFSIRNGEEEGITYSVQVADIELEYDYLMPNDFKTLNVCINISELQQNGQLRSTKTINPDNVFCFWE